MPMPKIANEIEWLIDIYNQDQLINKAKDGEKIKLSQLISKLGFFYEKFRNAIDYNEEHLVRRNSIERLLKRQILFLQEKRAEKISKTLIYEFIRARYLPNNQLPEKIIDEVAITINKYLIILDYLKKRKNQKLINWVISLASAEINEQLNPIAKELAMANLMYSHLVDNIAFNDTEIEEKEKNLQIYIAVLKTLLKADIVALNYQLFKLYLPNWQKTSSEETLEFAKNINIFKRKIDSHIGHPLAFQLSSIVRRQAVFFSILKELIEKNPGQQNQIFTNPDVLEDKVEDIAIYNYQKIKSKLIGTAFRVVIYIFFTKTILAFLLELPFDYFFLQTIHWHSLIINVVFHPVLMLLIAFSIKVPGDKNTKIIVEEIKKIVYGQDRQIVFKPKKSLRAGSSSFWMLNLVYLLMFAVSFGLIIVALKTLKFNMVSGFLFIFFLTIISFFGFRLRNMAKQYSVVPRKDNLFNFIIDFISLPVVRVGRFISTNFSKVNIFLYLLDFIIETPFKMLVEFLEKAVSFINDKREEIVEE